MGVSFLTPIGALFALLAVLPLAVYVERRRRSDAVRLGLGLAPSRRRRTLALGASLVAVPALIGLAAAQPVITKARTVPQRSDAEVFVVLDTSRSMLASKGSGDPTRFERARDEAIELQERLGDVPVGIASFTDRVLPHLFPTVDQRVFDETIREAVGIERPPPSMSFGTNVTALDALGAVPTLNFFTPGVTRRALVVFTDGESEPVTGALSADFARKPHVDVTFVRVGDASERIWESGVAEAAYAADPGATATLASAANLVHGRVLDEGDVSGAAAAARSAVGAGPTTNRRIEGSREALMPFVALLAIFPLGFVLYRRNL